MRTLTKGKLALAALELTALSAVLSLAIAAGAPAATPMPVSSCQTLSAPGAYTLTTDLAASDATCIEITASDVKLDLAGHTMTCTGSGFAGSCQVTAFTSHGVYIPRDLHLTDVVVKGPGTITGFDNGVTIVGSDALVKGLTISGPACDPSDCDRPLSNGIAIPGTLIGDPTQGIVDLGPANVTLSGNRVSNYARGISLIGSQCTGAAGCVLNDNVVQDNFGQIACLGIFIDAVTGYTITGTVATSNGLFPAACFPPAGGISLAEGSTGNVVTRNDASNNRGFGITVGPGTDGNLFTNNTARGNTLADLRAFPGTNNTWLDNNRCNTESGAVPSSVCNPGE